MTPERRFAILVSILVVLAVAGGLRSRMSKETVELSGFAAEVDIETLENLAVYHEGRVKSFASHANSTIDIVSGPVHYEGQSPAFTFLELMFRPQAYVDADIVYVKNEPLRYEIIDALEGRPGSTEPGFRDRMATFAEVGLISQQLLSEPKVQARLQRLGSDLIRWGKFVQMLQAAEGWKDPNVLANNFRIVPPPPGAEAWSIPDDLLRPSALTQGMPEIDGGVPVPPLEADLARSLGADWAALETAWKQQDAAAVNASAARLASGLREVNPSVYPETRRLSLESFYFRAYNLTWVWMFYLLAVIPLLLAVVYRWKGARLTGLLLFLLAFGLHTWSLGLRWYVSGRWPNSNMFEAVTTAAWFGGVAAVALLYWAKGTLGNIFLLTSAVASMVALMCAYYMPVQLNPNISNMMPVLNDLWLYIHTNVIIWSYVLIFMAAVSAGLYLLWRLCGNPPTYVKLGGAGMLAMGPSDDGADVTAGDGPMQAVAAGGGGGSAPSAVQAALAKRAESAAAGRTGQVLDGVTMVLMELSFVMLWAGLVMGAIWADHSWGRPWGWDPKEVFALNTFLVFAVLVHSRLKVRDKGLWTAWLALIGAGVMLFNWVIINFVITGLHSYA